VGVYFGSRSRRSGAGPASDEERSVPPPGPGEVPFLNMSARLKDKDVLVTGGTRGIGRAIAELCLEEGARVAICARRREGVERAVAEMSHRYGGRIVGTAADVGDAEDVSALFGFTDEKFGGLDILVNSAGVGIFKPVAELSIAEWRQVIDTNLTGAFYCSREALRRFRNRGGGFIVNISSLAGRNPFATGAAYNASKFGLNGFSEAMMMDHRYDNVRVSYIMPGSVDTGFRSGSEGQRTDWKIAASDVAGIVVAVLTMPERTLISRVEVRPSKPGKG